MSDDKNMELKNSGVFTSRDAVFLELLEVADSLLNKMQVLTMQYNELEKRVELEIDFIKNIQRDSYSVGPIPQEARGFPQKTRVVFGLAFSLGVLIGALVTFIWRIS